jgi:hypothetical protein
VERKGKEGRYYPNPDYQNFYHNPTERGRLDPSSVRDDHNSPHDFGGDKFHSREFNSSCHQIRKDRALEPTHVLSREQSDDDEGSEDEGLSLFLKRNIPTATEDFDTHAILTELWESRQEASSKLVQAGTRSFVVQYTDDSGATRTYQRDASMISLIPPKEIKDDPSEINLGHRPPHVHRSLALLSPIEEGEYVLIKDSKESKTWYCAQVLEKLPDRIRVSYCTTITPSLTKYAKATYEENLGRVREAKTWSIPTGESITVD